MSLFEPEQPTSLQQQQHAQRSMDLVSRGQQRHHRHPSHEHAKHDAMNKDRHHLHPPPYQHYRSLPPQQKSSQTVVSCIVNLVLSKLLDALLFTSALALAAYNYWKGDLHKRERIEASPAMYDDKEQHRIMDIRQWRHTHPPLRQQQHHHHHPRQQRESLEDSKRRRTMEWAESMARQQSQHSRSSSNCSNSNSSSSSSGTCNSLGNDKHDGGGAKRHIVLPSLQLPSVTVTDVNSTLIGAPADTSVNDKEPQEDEMFTRMEEQLQSLIEQGQAALTSKANDLEEMDDQELAMRKAFAAGGGGA
ncbi:hypothetical protein O0I10_008741 [Lichtheimia ornata]|uniref:Uncharacterized protein n=1 Tax=Lichtheimia ornata TaxID=688661 RepID=A0AAD7UZU4_9FUNG|nr:uncharacterized protein O0I10_008741 [Lichtheimia ornata]KAJ8655652.1 hypothetical protein O0I10_008741 [Lichtheimia ornata]